MNELAREAYAWILPALTTALVVLTAFALVVGVWLMVHPASMLSAAAGANRWLSLRRSLRPLDVPRPIERPVYRHHRAFGAVVLGAALYGLARWFLAYDRTAFLTALGPRAAETWSWLVLALETVFVGVCALLVPLGVILVVRPSLLKGPEARANTWLSTRRVSRPVDLERRPLDRVVARHPRISGAVATAGALYVLATLTPALLR